jgi:quinol monooxygenase YgiN
MTDFVPLALPAFPGPLAVVGVARPLPERAADLREALLALVAPTQGEAGCEQYVLHDGPGGDLWFYERWSSREHLAAHLAQPAVVAFQERRGDYLRSDLEVTWLIPA